VSPALTWYLERLGRMTPGEVAGRVRDRGRQELWTLQRSRGGLSAPPMTHSAELSARSIGEALGALAGEEADALVACADGLLAGKWEVLGVPRDDLRAPDWSLDPLSGRRYPEDRCSFRIDYRRSDDDRRVKQVWELSRHHHLTVLAAAWRVSGNLAYPEMVARHLRSWWRHNPPASGVNWASGIEIGIRLISWVWVRRLLDNWEGVQDLFDGNDQARRQIYWHQRYLAAFRSAGSSANNHVIAEAAGQVVASCAFDWFAETPKWLAEAIAVLQDELRRNTFESGVNREQAFEYHGLVTELGIIAGLEAEAAGHLISPATWALLCRMTDVLAAVMDAEGCPPRYGDGDDGRALLLNPPDSYRWATLLSVGGTVFGPLDWWPETSGDAASLLLGALAGRRIYGGPRPARRPAQFNDAGLTILRTAPGDRAEIWCRCDGGPHGFLSIAAHAHADALSVEVRHRGTQILADPGTYCYQGEPQWRSYFRSTAAHNTVEIDGLDQSEPKGPFLWTRKAEIQVIDVCTDGDAPRWCARHNGYSDLTDPVWHQRTAELDTRARVLAFTDELECRGTHLVEMRYHLGPDVDAKLTGCRALLEWRYPHAGSAILNLPSELIWSAHFGDTDPICGWYSPAFGRKQPSVTLVGRSVLGQTKLSTTLEFSQEPSDRGVDSRGGISTDMATAKSKR